ncbi:importin [Hamiltosporidium tvaerminnensis]|uniref:Importin n=1 Tax=Hamiltosporidium tvaerminnensis TaxID=1176355 RepID=A0A4Q9KXQ7_9MICR|nr:Nonsense-mediated mRNA decay protein 5 [Hamiltosporidium tvaerminnensis]TBT99713.1 importin [Hamiltosporidium tvaerminnensis]
MDTSSLRSVFLDTLSPDNTKRTTASDRLLSLQKNHAFILHLPTSFMQDTDQSVKRIAALYFKNSISHEFASFSPEEQDQLLNAVFINISDPSLCSVYISVLQHIIQNCCEPFLQKIATHAATFISSPSTQTVSLYIHLFILKQAKSKFDSSSVTLNTLFDTTGSILISLPNTSDYLITYLTIKLFCQATDYYKMPRFFEEYYLRVYDLCHTLLSSTNVYNDTNTNFLKTRKWCAHFLYKAVSKSQKNFLKKKENNSFIRQNLPTNTFLMVIQKQDLPKTHQFAGDFFVLISRKTELPQKIFLIEKFIFPNLVFKDKEKFEFYPDSYLREKYNYYNNDLRNNVMLLLNEYNKDKETKQQLLQFVEKSLSIPTNSFTTACNKYGAMEFLSCLNDSDFLIKFVIPEINSEFLFLQSQVCYILQFFEAKIVEEKVGTNFVAHLLEKIVAFSGGENEILKVDALLTLPFFFTYSDQTRLKSLISYFVPLLLNTTKTYDLEALNDVMESVIKTYGEEVSSFAPSLISMMVDCMDIKSKNIEKMCGYLRNISGLMDSVRNKEILRNMFERSFLCLINILKENITECYAEVLDVIVSYMFGVKVLDKEMYEILRFILEGGDFSGVVDELSAFFDNFISYGGNNSLPFVNPILNYISVWIKGDEYFFDDDYTAGCKVIESILLNLGSCVKDNIKGILELILEKYESFEREGSSLLYFLLIVMECFILEKEVVIQVLNEKNFLNKFLIDLKENEDRMNRLHDKKVICMFLGEILNMKNNIFRSTDIKELLLRNINEITKTIENKSEIKEYEENEEEEEYEESCSEDCYQDVLEEDYTFESPLDSFDVKEYLRRVLGSVNKECFGWEVMGIMSEEDKRKIYERLWEK